MGLDMPGPEVDVATPRTAEAGVIDADAEDVTGAKNLREHARAVAACTACGLHAERVKPVLGQGPDTARLAIVGAVPSRQGDLHGLALAGASRNVLEHALTRSGIAADDVRFTSVVRCRPSRDREPSQDEIDACSMHLRTELRLVAPEVVVGLGSFATSVLLGRSVVLERVAGYRLDIFHGVTLVPTHHPADVVRGVPRAAEAIPRDIAVAKAVLDGRMKTGAQALAELRSRLIREQPATRGPR